VQRRFSQVDVFGSEPFTGNALAVVVEGSGLTAEQMKRFAEWTNLSETTFILPPDQPGADYQVRIFNLGTELPFAGHPTLGTCHAWLSAGNEPRAAGEIVQQCAAGLVRIRRTEAGLAFAAPPVRRGGPVEEDVAGRVAEQLGIPRRDMADLQWADNGPGWIAVLLHSADAVLALQPGALDMDIGVAGPYPEGSECAFEVRAFFPVQGRAVEDPVTGSFNASLAQWLLSSGRASSPYVASQGTALGRRGRVHISRDETDGSVWVAGATTTLISGEVDL
jgi:PhzF family phenazine biosynthesis protein